jgi:hypothetical protein
MFHLEWFAGGASRSRRRRTIPQWEAGRRWGAAIRAAQAREYFRIALDYNPLFLKNFFSCAPPDFLSPP